MNKCVLIYDDDVDILMVTKIVLEQFSYRVETRTCCDEILKDIEDIKPGMILLDLRIPNIGGEEATKMVKENSSTKHIPVIVFSANTHIQQACERSHADGCLKKPFEVDELLAIVETNTSE